MARQRLLKALISPAKIIVLDEPTGELDETIKQKVWNLIVERTNDKTLICNTHDTNQDIKKLFNQQIQVKIIL